MGTDGNYTDFAFQGKTNYLPIHDHNLYYKTASQTDKVIMTQSADTYYTPAQISSWEATGLAVNPLLIDVSAFNWNLRSDSSCINAGVDVSLSTDYYGNPIVGLPDIGAIEYVSFTADSCIMKADTTKLTSDRALALTLDNSLNLRLDYTLLTLDSEYY